MVIHLGCAYLHWLNALGSDQTQTRPIRYRRRNDAQIGRHTSVHHQNSKTRIPYTQFVRVDWFTHAMYTLSRAMYIY
jgi:hypothetical protein